MSTVKKQKGAGRILHLPRSALPFSSRRCEPAWTAAKTRSRTRSYVGLSFLLPVSLRTSLIYDFLFHSRDPPPHPSPRHSLGHPPPLIPSVGITEVPVVLGRLRARPRAA